MGWFMKKSIIFPIIILCALSIVNSSSGVSQFQTSRGVQMKVVNSEDALISLPKAINMDIKVIKEIIYYYQLSTIYISESEGTGDLVGSDSQTEATKEPDQTVETSTKEISESMETEERKVEVVIKELVDTEERVNIRGNECKVTIKNNMCSDIRLEKIEFDDPYLQSDGNGLFIGVGDKCDVTITYNKNPDIIDDDEGIEEFESKATLFFSWDKGKSTIYEDVIINLTIEVKDPKEVIL